MFRFENPEYLYLLALVPALALAHYLTNYHKRLRLRKYGDPELVSQLTKDVSRWRPEVKMWLPLLALACLILAAARPQYGTKVDTSERNGIEAIIAIDVSNSMMANDVRPTRLEKAKMLFSNMIDQMHDDRVGLVVFAGDAFVQLPITNDYVSAKMFLDQINPSMIRVQGTDIGMAIDMSSKCFTQQKGISRAIFVITDGEDHEAGAIEAAKEAAKKGIHVYVLGVGSPEGGHVPIPGTNQYFIDDEGNAVVSQLDEDMCRQIAQAGNGAYVYVSNSSSAQRELSSHVSKLAKSTMETTTYSEYDEQYQGFILLALVFLAIDLLLLERKNRRLTSLTRWPCLAVLIALFSMPSQAQNQRDYIRRGNRLFRDSLYDKAQVEYQKAYQQDSTSVEVLYNLANSMMRQGNHEQALPLLQRAGKLTRDPNRRAMIFHNIGVILQGAQQFRQAMEAYKESLRHNPSDNETRYNYVLCQRQLKDEPKQDDQQNQEQDGNDQKDQQQEDQQKQEQQQEPQGGDINKDNAEQLLRAALQNERRTQEKVNREQQPQSRRLQKQW